MTETKELSTEDVILDVISRVKKRPFGYITEEDIAQEAWLIINNIMPKWDGKRSLEHFLMHSVTKRLRSFGRTFFRSEARRASVNFVELEDQPICEDVALANADMVKFLSENLPDALLADFNRIANGVAIPATRKATLLKCVKELAYG